MHRRKVLNAITASGISATLLPGMSTLSLAQTAKRLVPLAKAPAWPVASKLITYRGRLWFSASVKGNNHNSADIWSIDATGRDRRFERYLFSQDAGFPIVHRGLLYWPYEDMRDESSWGAASVTDGAKWGQIHLPTQRAFHLHSLREWDGALIGCTAAFNAGLHISRDKGSTWRLLAEFKPRSGYFTRLTDVGVENGRLYAKTSERTGQTLMEYRNGTLEDVQGWPQWQPLFGMTSHGDALYAVVGRGQDKHIWRVHQGVPMRLAPPGSEWNLRAMTSDGDRLWIVAHKRGGGGVVWSSKEGENWVKEGEFTGGIAFSIARLNGQTYVAGTSRDKQATIWGEEKPSADTSAGKPAGPALPARGFSAGMQRINDWSALRDKFMRAFGDDAFLRGHGKLLKREVYQAAISAPPARFFRSLLDAQKPDKDIDVFGGSFTARTASISNWALTWGIGLAGEKSIDPKTLTIPWRHQPNGPQKWFDPLLIGLWAIQHGKQDDVATIDALIARLSDRSDDPDFITSQFTGTLHALTGQQYAYDKQAWVTWWAQTRANWQQ